jgi:hypothetical protein
VQHHENCGRQIAGQIPQNPFHGLQSAGRGANDDDVSITAAVLFGHHKALLAEDPRPGAFLIVLPGLPPQPSEPVLKAF